MKLFAVLITLIFSSVTLAESITCQITEFADNKRTQSTVTLQSENDVHEGLKTFTSEFFPEITGFISLLQKDNQFFAVMSLHSDKLGTNSSGQYQMVVDGQHAQMQFIIPSKSLKLSGIEMLCQFSKPQQ